MAGLKIVVAGCVAAQEGETLLRRVPELDLVLGPHHANRCALQRLAVRPCGSGQHASALSVATPERPPHSTCNTLTRPWECVPSTICGRRLCDGALMWTRRLSAA